MVIPRAEVGAQAWESVLALSPCLKQGFLGFAITYGRLADPTPPKDSSVCLPSRCAAITDFCLSVASRIQTRPYVGASSALPTEASPHP